MTCCFTGQEIPKEKLFVLYYPPTMAHAGWDKSVYAAAHAGVAVRETANALRTYFRRHVVGGKLAGGILLAACGLAASIVWAATVLPAWSDSGIVARFALPILGLAVLSFGWIRVRAFLRRWQKWKQGGKTEVLAELKAIEELIAGLPEDPDAEQAAIIMRRPVPELVSDIAFAGSYFRAFTYMDFLFYPKLRHPASQDELPKKHSMARDAYYVGDIFYDSWRMFQKDRRSYDDPRFAGSGGRRGVI